ncbi:AtuA-related protein [Arenibacterium halophilum]|uniref:AtuA-like ferredoxin-fold domain-containing protein n=1 Tax=Arenibacterium halophilum TaxID=2583821 RepID=A0ABY2X141_9RHOB|nr:hypothetical protein [Arenibacterium halophilum]TMV08358.1 hypothetical protein FGK64_20565 [Arenibacterium halophilum]
MKLHDIAHGRTGDKGTTSNISIIAYHPEDWPKIEANVTADRVAAIFGPGVKVTRYTLPHLCAMNFVVENALKGGVTRSVAIDAHGKGLVYAVLELSL